MSCGCNKKSSYPVSTTPPKEDEYVKRHTYFSDYSTLEKQQVAETLGFASGNVTVVNYPDEEDITERLLDSKRVISFKDKKYDPFTFSGKGRKFLRKNTVKTIGDCNNPYKNVLTQEMFQDCDGYPLVNTIFIIQYDYDLDNMTIDVPQESVLLFLGGSVTNGTLNLNNTLILPAGLDLDSISGNDINEEYSVNPCLFTGTFKAGSIVMVGGILKYYNGNGWVEIGKASTSPYGRMYNVYVGVSTDEPEGMTRIPYTVGSESKIYYIKTEGTEKVTIYVPTEIRKAVLVQLSDKLIIPSVNSEVATVTDNYRVIGCLQYSKIEINEDGLIQIKTLENYADSQIV